ncbi:thioesterase superfamily protein [Denitrovibrio acetiphilus DSM 12809]|uniref:Thioesterase superfamily protein n=1 Tax=Denitrovibrio acetiphilus (strain DSM 12809 / NBRC 114555 / N2460) TaxID=522772 RepID=D4H8X7_DENA2|nr:acyl-CoA thioesterase [Denitrovibrio acetiphilus]ADD68476.1 thioesterase superfamily protein [Denitrovibrio acetiphilus DSM 12809]
METYTLVRPEHLNHYGYLFGGVLLKWIDECAFLTAAKNFRGVSFVTVAMDKIVFKHQVANGSVLRFKVEPVKQGTTSITYEVKVFGDAPCAEREQEVFSTNITFVSIDKNGRPTPLPHKLDIS